MRHSVLTILLTPPGLQMQSFVAINEVAIRTAGVKEGRCVAIRSLGMRRFLTSSAMSTEIGVVFNRPNDRLWLLRIREWARDNGELFGKIGTPSVTPMGSTDDALAWRAERPHERLVITFGFGPNQVCVADPLATGEPIIVSEADPDAADTSPADNPPHVAGAVVCGDVRPVLRKTLIRMALRKKYEIRPPRNETEYADYFALRYTVWKQQGFLRRECEDSRLPWEVDFWDRTAMPICAIGPNGKVVGCVRLVKSHGAEEEPYVSRINELLAQANDPVLLKLFKFPNAPTEPFDILPEFPGFRSYYRKLLTSRLRLAEVGRVVVHPDYRGQSLSEVLVDTAISVAQSKSYSWLFLACRLELVPLYQMCGFKAVEGMTSEKFTNIPLPSIVMERPLTLAGAVN